MADEPSTAPPDAAASPSDAAARGALAVTLGAAAYGLGVLGASISPCSHPTLAPLVSGAVGLALGAAWGAPRPRSLAADVGFGTSILVCGVLTGCAYGALERASFVGGGAIFGFGLGLVGALVPFSLLRWAHRASFTPRPRSTLHASARRRSWRWLGVVLLAYGGLAARGDRHHEATIAVSFAGAALLLAFTALDLRAVRRLLAWSKGLERVHDLGGVPAATRITDLGEGDDVWIARDAERHHPYRAEQRARHALVGAPFAVQSTLTSRAIAGVSVACAALALDLGTRGGPSPPPPTVVMTSAQPLPAVPLAWYGERPLVLVPPDPEVGVAAVEDDIVALRWDAHTTGAALSVQRFDDRLGTRWRTLPVTSKPGSARTKLAVSGDRVYLADSEGRLHLYGYASGAPIGSPRPLEHARELCGRPGRVAGEAWVRDHDDARLVDRGTMIDENGDRRAADRPAWCPRPDEPATGSRGDDLSFEARDDGAAVVDVPTPGGAPRPVQVGYDTQTQRERWRVDLQFDGARLHAEPNIRLTGTPGRILAGYELEGGGFRIGARSVETGALAWVARLEPGVGTRLVSLSATPRRVYALFDQGLLVLDGEHGTVIGQAR